MFYTQPQLAPDLSPITNKGGRAVLRIKELKVLNARAYGLSPCREPPFRSMGSETRSGLKMSEGINLGEIFCTLHLPTFLF